jgi:hypothetical protein
MVAQGRGGSSKSRPIFGGWVGRGGGKELPSHSAILTRQSKGRTWTSDAGARIGGYVGRVHGAEDEEGEEAGEVREREQETRNDVCVVEGKTVAVDRSS